MPTPFHRHPRVGIWAHVSLMTALGCDYDPVRGNNVGKTIDDKKHYNQPRGRRRGGERCGSSKGERTRAAGRGGRGRQSPSRFVEEELRRRRIKSERYSG